MKRANAAIDDGHAFDLSRRALKGTHSRCAESRVSPKRPRKKRPRQLGVSELILRDALQDATHFGIGGKAELLGREQRPEGLPHTPFGNRELEYVGKGHCRKAVGNDELGRTHFASTITSRQ